MKDPLLKVQGIHPPSLLFVGRATQNWAEASGHLNLLAALSPILTSISDVYYPFSLSRFWVFPPIFLFGFWGHTFGRL